jgi:Fe2+ or Zn2+ uptake regulation protein
MGKEDRKEVVLAFMREYPVAMPPLLVYRNLRLREGITFSQDSVRRYLEQLANEGLVDRVKKEPLENQELVTADPDDRAYYIISDEGADFVDSGL